MSNLIRGISENGGVVFCGVDSTEIVRTAEKLHTTSATCSAALGRLLTGVSLMGAMLKDDGDSITLRVSGGGPAGVVIACTDAHGNVKGCIDHPLVELPAKENGHLDVGGAVGKDGVLTVIRDNKLQKEPTVGQVPLVSGEIAEDITSYYAYSEQIPTVCALGVLVDKDLSIACAGGYPSDVSLYQGCKCYDPAEMAVKDGGIIIAIMEARDIKEPAIYMDSFKYDTMEDMEKALRAHFTIPFFVAFNLFCLTHKDTVILVTLPRNFNDIRRTGQIPVETVQEAWDLAQQKLKEQGKDKDYTINIMPHATKVMPILREK